MHNTDKRQAIDHFFRCHGTSTEHCHGPYEECKQKAIRAHSVPSGTVLSTLTKDGHVVMPQMKLKVPPPAEISFSPVGRNKATTFTGLCAQHDNELFRPIDDALPDVKDMSHLFLLSYRAVLREYHVCLHNAWRFQSVLKKQVDLGLAPSSEPSNFAMFATEQLCNAFECYEYKCQYDSMFLSGDWSQLHHHVIILKGQLPTIAVSSMFSLDEIDASQTPRVTLSLFPSNTDVLVVFSALSNDAPFAFEYLNQVLTATGYLQKYFLSKLILQSCDNIVIHPQYYNSLTQQKQNAICEYYTRTIQSSIDEHEDYRLNLF